MRRSSKLSNPCRCGGTIAVELLLNLPIWLILLLATVEFGELTANLQQVSLACRIGAEEASRTPSLPTKGEVPATIQTAIQRTLAGAGVCCSNVILQHNLGGTPVTLVSGDGSGGPPSIALPEMGTYVRVTAVARATQIAPNLLDFFGLKFSSTFLAQSATFRYGPSQKICNVGQVANLPKTRQIGNLPHVGMLHIYCDGPYQASSPEVP
jgi:Flp pilus assembly protein TadG